ncbi:MAG TPA: 4-vinyl reductase [Candidatus Competibacter sp.]|nr:4-vinyl reductase [Candidatus Competibacter sp.]
MVTEVSILIENNNPRLFSNLTIALLHNGFKIAKYRKREADHSDQSWVLFSTLDDQIDFAKIKQILSRIDGVLDIKKSGPDDSAPNLTTSTQLNGLAKSIAGRYPDIIKPVFEFESSLSANIRSAMLYELGEHTGQYIFAARFNNYRINGSILAAVSQLVLPALRPFTIADSNSMEVKLSLSPFALNRHSSTRQCHFIAGLMAGLLNSPPDATPVRVSESSCRAQGNEQCLFTIIKSQ